MNDARLSGERIEDNRQIYITEQMHINRDIGKHRMTYEHAGEYFRAMKLLKDYAKIESEQGELPIGILWDCNNWELVLPDDGKFASFLDLNADRLQLFDMPKKLVLTRTSGNIHCSHFPDEIEINPDLDKWEYVEELL
jgi:hypothetical protein